MKKLILFLKTMDRHLSYGQKAFIFVVFFIIFLLVVSSIDNNKSNNSYRGIPGMQGESTKSWKSSNDNSMAYVMAKEFIKNRLKAPSTAKFQSSTKKVTYLGSQSYYVHVKVDAQNSFGAMIRKTFSVEVEQIEKEKWRCNTIEEY